MSLRLVEILRCEEHFKYYTYHLNCWSGLDKPFGEVWFSRTRLTKAQAYRECFGDYLQSRRQPDTKAKHMACCLTKQEFRYFRQALKGTIDRAPELRHNYLCVEKPYIQGHRRRGRGYLRSLYQEEL